MNLDRLKLRARTGLALFVLSYFGLKFLSVLLAIISMGCTREAASIASSTYGDEVRQFQTAILIWTCVVLALAKWSSHPFRKSAYLQWLRTTPWTSRLPLPLGPTHMVWWDVLKLAMLAALAKWDLQLDPGWVVVAFGTPYLLVGAGVMAGSSEIAAFLLVVGLGGMCLAAPQAQVMAAILGALYPVFYAGLRHHLKTLSWDEPERVALDVAKLKKALGWPYDALGPGRIFPKISFGSALAIAVLSAWMIYCIGTMLEHMAEEDFASVGGYMGAGLALCIGIGIAIGRALSYAGTCWPSLMLFGRLGSGRWIIPSYDRGLLCPLAILVATGVLASAGYAWNASPSLIVATTVGVDLPLALGAGPTQRDWQLTAEYRLPSPVLSKQQLRSVSGA